MSSVCCAGPLQKLSVLGPTLKREVYGLRAEPVRDVYGLRAEPVVTVML